MADEVALCPGSLLQASPSHHPSSTATLASPLSSSSCVHANRPTLPLPFTMIWHFGMLTFCYSSLRYRDELYKECAAALARSAVLIQRFDLACLQQFRISAPSKNLEAITASIQCAFNNFIGDLFACLEQVDKEDESSMTAMAMFLWNNVLVVLHIGDFCLAI